MVYTVCCYIHIVPEPLQELCMYIGFIYIRGLDIYIYIYIYRSHSILRVRIRASKGFQVISQSFLVWGFRVK